MTGPCRHPSIVPPIDGAKNPGAAVPRRTYGTRQTRWLPLCFGYPIVGRPAGKIPTHARGRSPTLISTSRGSRAARGSDLRRRSKGPPKRRTPLTSLGPLAFRSPFPMPPSSGGARMAFAQPASTAPAEAREVFSPARIETARSGQMRKRSIVAAHRAYAHVEQDSEAIDSMLSSRHSKSHPLPHRRDSRGTMSA